MHFCFLNSHISGPHTMSNSLRRIRHGMRFLCSSFYRKEENLVIYHCSIKIIKRNQDRSAVAAATYRSGQKLTNEWGGICCSVNFVPLVTRYHLLRHPLQRQAQACCARNTGCPCIGVCFPSFGITAGASRSRTKSCEW